ncbi:hypothetical protein PSAB_01600 [Paenibacillus sabinae T27]|uniref:Uncharacterized protein n=1 Tax=Paenibacillus sabinae T27 TaxID=1268072 RepID=X4Z660_9BACL|nr:hypothetical protein PSAB_01600 [Paenibacillus sabinae T27]
MQDRIVHIHKAIKHREPVWEIPLGIPHDIHRESNNRYMGNHSKDSPIDHNNMKYNKDIPNNTGHTYNCAKQQHILFISIISIPILCYL